MAHKINQIFGLIKNNKILVFILLFSLAVCLFYSFYFQIRPAVDARAYDMIATNLVEGRGYRENIEVDILHDPAIARVGPLYEFFLAGIYKVFGHHYGPVWAIQALLHALNVWLIYLMALLIFKDISQKKTIGFLAAALFGFYPDLIEISAMLMIETVYLFLLCLTLYLFFYYFESLNWKGATILGLVSGLAVLARPPVLLLVLVLLFHFLCRKKFALVGFFLIFFISVFIPWSVRNYQTYGEFMPLGAAGAYNLWIGNYRGANGEQEPPREAFDFLATHETKEIQAESIKQFKSFIYNYPGEFVKLTLLRINKYFSIVRPMGFWFYQTGWSQFGFLCSSALASVVLFILGLGGVIKSIRLKNTRLYYLLAFAILTPLMIITTVVETRYRFQIYPLLAVFAGFFVVSLFKERGWWKNRLLWISAAIVFCNGLIDLYLSIDRFKERVNWFL